VLSSFVFFFEARWSKLGCPFTQHVCQLLRRQKFPRLVRKSGLNAECAPMQGESAPNGSGSHARYCHAHERWSSVALLDGIALLQQARRQFLRRPADLMNQDFIPLDLQGPCLRVIQQTPAARPAEEPQALLTQQFAGSNWYREEFDTQKQVWRGARAKLEELEQRIAELNSAADSSARVEATALGGRRLGGSALAGDRNDLRRCLQLQFRKLGVHGGRSSPLRFCAMLSLSRAFIARLGDHATRSMPISRACSISAVMRSTETLSVCTTKA